MGLFLVLLVTLLFPPVLLFGFYVVNPREEVVVLRFGRYVTTQGREGIGWMLPVGRKLRRVSTQGATLDVPASTVVDRNGNPIQVQASSS